VIAKGLALRRQKWPSESKEGMETEKGTLLESPQVTDEANYVFFFLANLVSECSMSSGITMASLRSIFGLAKLLIHAERVTLNEYQKAVAASKLDVIRAALVYEWYHGFKL
jgi:hypothetical protein